jgi:hypothetical protein
MRLTDYGKGKLTQKMHLKMEEAEGRQHDDGNVMNMYIRGEK